MTVLKSYHEYDENGEDKDVIRLELDNRFEDDIHFIVSSDVAGSVRCNTIEEAENAFRLLVFLPRIEIK